MTHSKNSVQNGFLVLILLLFFPVGSEAVSTETLFHIRYDIETANGKFIGERLTMIPAENAYRAEGFEKIRITGTSDALRETDVAPSATNNAYITLLTRHGLKSVSSKHGLFNLASTDKTILSYEGLIQHPFRVLHEGYGKGKEIYVIELEVWFSAIAFPDAWSLLYIKHTIKDFFSAMMPDFD